MVTVIMVVTVTVILTDTSELNFFDEMIPLSKKCAYSPYARPDGVARTQSITCRTHTVHSIRFTLIFFSNEISRPEVDQTKIFWNL
jgi:hypothetical protein